MSDELKSLRDSVLAKIKDERVTMRSRAYFALKVAVLALVALAVLVISVAICNFIFFAIQESGSDHLLRFGDRGVNLFIRFFPWHLLMLDIVLILLLEWLLRRFRFGYRSPVLYMLLGLIIISVSVGFAIERATAFNSFLRDRAHEQRLPSPFNDFFEHSKRPPGGPKDGMCRCTVIDIDGNIIIADDANFGSTTRLTLVLPEADIRATTSGITVGDVIFVAGDRDGDTLTVFGIKRVDDRPSRNRMPAPPQE